MTRRLVVHRCLGMCFMLILIALSLAACSSGAPADTPTAVAPESPLSDVTETPISEEPTATEVLLADPTPTLGGPVDTTPDIEMKETDLDAGATYDISFSPDGTLLAVGSGDGTIRLWNIASGTIARKIDTGGTGAGIALFSPDGKYVASQQSDTTLVLYDAATGIVPVRFEDQKEYLNDASFSADGKLVASSDRGGVAKVWNVADKSQVAEFKGENDYSTGAVAISPDGEIVATALGEDPITLWKLADKSVIRKLPISSNVLDIEFSPDGQMLAVAANDDTSGIWNVAGEDSTPVLPLGVIASKIAFSPDGSMVAAALPYDKVARVWNVSDGSVVKTVGADTLFLLTEVAWSPDSKTIATGGESMHFHLWHIR